MEILFGHYSSSDHDYLVELFSWSDDLAKDAKLAPQVLKEYTNCGLRPLAWCTESNLLELMDKVRDNKNYASFTAYQMGTVNSPAVDWS